MLPAGLAVLSVAGELIGALPSWAENGNHDFLREVSPLAQPSFPSDHIWPSDPPRYEPYCDNSALCHPLVALAAATSWEGAPPMWMACGQERLADSSKVIAQTAAQQDVSVLWEQYEAMPHTWAQVFPAWPQSTRCIESWARACQVFAEGKNQISSSGIVIEAQTMKEKDVSVVALTELTPAKALMLVEEKRRGLKAFVGAKVKSLL